MPLKGSSHAFLESDKVVVKESTVRERQRQKESMRYRDRERDRASEETGVSKNAYRAHCTWLFLGTEERDSEGEHGTERG